VAEPKREGQGEIGKLEAQVLGLSDLVDYQGIVFYYGSLATPPSKLRGMRSLCIFKMMLIMIRS
jgi:hypothetical protein